MRLSMSQRNRLLSTVSNRPIPQRLGLNPAWGVPHFAARFDRSLYYGAAAGFSGNPAGLISTTRASQAWGFDDQGNLQTFANDNALVSTDGGGRGLVVPGSRTNAIRNAALAGGTAGVIGSGGTLPNNCVAAGSLSGLSASVSYGTRRGMSTMRLRLWGTPNASSSYGVQFEAANHIAVAAGQPWTTSGFLALFGGSTANVASVQLRGRTFTSGGSGVEASAGTNRAASLTDDLRRFDETLVVANSTSAFIAPQLLIGYTNGQAIDITVEVAIPTAEQVELGANLVVNPNFDADVAGWLGENANLTWENGRVRVTSTTSGFGARSARQTFTNLVPGRTYRIGVTPMASGGSAAPPAGQTVLRINASNNSTLVVAATGTALGTPIWAQFVATEATVNMHLRFEPGAGADTTTWVEFDTTSLQEINATPSAPIVTTGAAATRPQPVHTFALGAYSYPLNLDLEFRLDGHWRGAERRILTLFENAQNTISVRRLTTGNLEVISFVSNVAVLSLDLGPCPADADHRLSMRLQPGSVAFSLNGQAAVTASPVSLPNVNTAFVGTNSAGGVPMWGSVRSIVIYSNQARTNDQLVASALWGNGVVDLDFARTLHRYYNRQYGDYAQVPFQSVSTGGGTAQTLTGEVVSFAANVLRRTNRGALVEEQRTNLAPRSRPSHANWAPNGVGTTATEAPARGALTGKIVAGNGATWHRVQTINDAIFSVTSGLPYYFEFWYAPGTSGRGRFEFRNSAGNTGTSFRGPTGNITTSDGTAAGTITNLVNEALGGGVWRVRGTFTPNFTGATGGTGFGPDSAVVGETVEFVHFHVEQTSSTTPLEPIITNGASATRLPDILQDTNVTLANEETIFWRGVVNALPPSGVNAHLYTFHDGTSNNRVRAFVSPAGSAGIGVAVAGSESFRATADGSVTAGTYFTVIVRRDAPGNFRVFFNGVAVSTTLALAMPFVTTRDRGRRNDGQQYLNGYIARTGRMGRALSDAEILTLHNALMAA